MRGFVNRVVVLMLIPIAFIVKPIVFLASAAVCLKESKMTGEKISCAELLSLWLFTLGMPLNVLWTTLDLLSGEDLSKMNTKEVVLVMLFKVGD